LKPQTYKTFVLASRNQHKVKEILDILPELKNQIKTLNDFPAIPEIAETGKTYEENAVLKAKTVCAILSLPVIADDSGLEIESLDWGPGVFSSRFLGETTSYQIKNQEILKKLINTSVENRKARFICAAAAAFPNGKILAAQGKIQGYISEQIRGESGFGYDPIFFLPEYGKTMAELLEEEKNKISHRALAFRKLMQLINSSDLTAGRETKQSNFKQ
jgi:XTP/dITP diphosphohydrolase